MSYFAQQIRGNIQALGTTTPSRNFHSFFHGSEQNYTHHRYHLRQWLGKDILYRKAKWQNSHHVRLHRRSATKNITRKNIYLWMATNLMRFNLGEATLKGGIKNHCHSYWYWKGAVPLNGWISLTLTALGLNMVNFHHWIHVGMTKARGPLVDLSHQSQGNSHPSQLPPRRVVSRPKSKWCRRNMWGEKKLSVGEIKWHQRLLNGGIRVTKTYFVSLLKNLEIFSYLLPLYGYLIRFFEQVLQEIISELGNREYLSVWSEIVP